MAGTKKTRSSHPKVRTGCHTCKARRVKCDETRPSCKKCLSTGRTCEGYKRSSQWIITVAPPRAPPSIFSDDRSRRSFDYFRSVHVHNISYFFEGGNWGDVVLQAAHTSPAVRHAVIALACSHEDFRGNWVVDGGAPQYAYAEGQYGKAIRCLIRETAGDGGQMERLKALVCGLLFMSIEVLRRNTGVALRHLEGCTKIVREAEQRMEESGKGCEASASDPEVVLRQEVVPMFVRLDIQAGLLLTHKAGDLGYESAPFASGMSVMSTLGDDQSFPTFTSTVEASNALYGIMRRVHKFVRIGSSHYQYDSIGDVPLELLAMKQRLQLRLGRWETEFASLAAICKSTQLRNHCELLRIQYLTTITMLSSSLHAEESILDAYTSVFEELVYKSAELQRARVEQSNGKHSHTWITDTCANSMYTCSSAQCIPSPKGPIAVGTGRPTYAPATFTLDTGLLFPLYWVALKCRDGLVRRRAIKILGTCSQEGIWIGSIHAEIAKRIIEIEEGQPYELYPEEGQVKICGDIPEYLRVHSVVTEIDRRRRTARLACLQRLNGMDGEWHERVEWVHW